MKYTTLCLNFSKMIPVRNADELGKCSWLFFFFCASADKGWDAEDIYQGLNTVWGSGWGIYIMSEMQTIIFHFGW